MLYMWMRYGKPDASMTGNGLLAGLVAITAPSGFVNPMASVIIGLIAGVLVCLSVEFVERVLKVGRSGRRDFGARRERPLGRDFGRAVRRRQEQLRRRPGTACAGIVTGLFYGDAGQLVAQLIGVATLIGFVFTFSFVVNMVRRCGSWASVCRRKPNSRVWTSRKWVRSAIRSSCSGPNRLLSGGRDMGSKCRAKHSPRTRDEATVGHPPRPRLPAIPWRDPHTVPPAESGGIHRALEHACLEHPQSADLRTCLGMAHAMNYDVYGRWTPSRMPRAMDRTDFWAQMKYAELHYRLRTLVAPSRRR